MPLRPKTQRRLLIILSVAGGLSAAGGGLYGVRSYRHEQVRQAWRTDGFDAYRAGEFARAARDFNRFTTSAGPDAPPDCDVLFGYAVALINLPRPNGGNLVDARNLLTRFLEVRPDTRDAQHRLLTVYQALHYPDQTLALANALLARDRNDVPALAAEANELFRQGAYAAAMKFGEQLNDRAPLDLAGQQLTLELMHRLRYPPEALVARARELAGRFPGDPRFELLQADAAYLTGDADAVVRHLHAAAAEPAPDDAFVSDLAAAYDRMGLWNESLALVTAAVDRRRPADPPPSVWLWANLGLRQVVAGRAEPTHPCGSDPLLMGIRAYGLLAAGDPLGDPPPAAAAEGRRLVDELAKRPDSPVAAVWVSCLRAVYADPPPPPLAAVAMASAAVQMGPQNAVARFLLGRAQSRLGEVELALQAFHETSVLAPGWFAPYAAAGGLLLDRGDLPAAAAQARLAADRAPGQPAVQRLAFVTAYRRLPRSAPPADAAALLDLARSRYPKAAGDPRADAATVDLLARAGRKADAVVAAVSLLNGSQTPELLYDLAAVDDVDHLGLAAGLVAATATADPIDPRDPDAAYHAAMAIQIAGRTADARAYLDRAAAAHPVPAVAVAALRFREGQSDAGVADGWRALADSAAGDLAVQQATLASPAARLNRSLVDRVLDRLQTLTGPDAVEWRLARARWQLDAEAAPSLANDAAASMGEVVHKLPRSPAPQVLWARALERLGDVAGAVAHLRAAAALAPADAGVSADLARLLIRQGQGAAATELLDRARAVGPPSAAVPLAHLYFDAGQYRTALALLAPPGVPPASVGEDPDRDLLLARTRAALGDAADAGRQYDAILAGPGVSADAVKAAAAFHAARGEETTARAALARADALGLPAGGADVIRGQFEATFGTDDRARAAYTAATTAGPRDARTWLARAGFELHRRNWPAALAVATEAARAAPDDPTVAALRDRVRSLTAVAPGPDFQPVVDVLANDPADPTATAALAAVASAAAAADRTAALAAVATENPTDLPVQAALVGRYLADADADAAVSAATRAAKARPTDPEAARLVYVATAAADRWPAAREAAVAWRARGGTDPQAADLAAADVLLHLDQPEVAAAQVGPYVPDATAAAARALPADPTPETVDLLTLYARATAAARRYADAGDVLRPLAERSPRWRRRWLRVIAATAPDAPAAAAQVARVEPLMPPDSLDDRVALAEAWYTLGNRLGDPDGFRRCLDALDPLTDVPAAPTDAWLLLAATHEELGDPAAAEADYRRVLARDPALPLASNNLAWLLLLRGGDLAEARRLAERAAVALPGDANVRDTLGLVALTQGDWATAAAQYDAALRVAPNDAAALAGSAETLAHAGAVDRATTLFKRAEAAARGRGRPMSPPVARQIERVRLELRPAE